MPCLGYAVDHTWLTIPVLGRSAQPRPERVVASRQSPIRQISSRSVSGAGVTLKLTSQPGASRTESPLSFLHHWGSVPAREAPSVVHPIAESSGQINFCPSISMHHRRPHVPWDDVGSLED